MQDASKLPQGNTPFEKLVDLMARLRDPETGCPWDVEQTFQTIAPIQSKKPMKCSMQLSKAI